MNVLPTTSDRRLRLALFPFKACIVGLPSIGILLVGIATLGRWNDQYGTRGIVEKTLAGRYAMLTYGYIGCIVALLVAAVAIRDKPIRRSALAFAVIGIVLLFLIYPVTQFAKTR
jgi:hypothetical protein